MNNFSFFMLVTFLTFLISATAVAQGTIANGNANINVRTNPELSKKEGAYQEAIKALTDEQRAILEALHKEAVLADEPQIALILDNQTFTACKERDPSIDARYEKMMQTMRFRSLDQMQANWHAIVESAADIKFIDFNLLSGHLEFSRDLRNQMTQGLGQINAQLIREGKNDEPCKEMKEKLEKDYSAPYVVTSSHPGRPDTAVVRNPRTGKIEACRITFGHLTEDQHSLTGAFALNNMEEVPYFDFSSKIHNSDKPLPVEDAWIDFGSLTTRFAGRRVSAPQEALYMGRMPMDSIVPVIAYLKNNPIVAGAKAIGWNRTIAYEMPLISSDDIAKIANCVAAIQPRYSEPLQKAGFTITPDERHQSGNIAASKEKHYLYKTTYLYDDPSNPGICVWQFKPFKHGNGEIGGSLITSGFMKEGAVYNYKTVFWIIGAEIQNGHQVRLDFTDGSFVTEDAGTGAPISTEEHQNKKISGQRYEIHMPFTAFIPFVKGIERNGLTLNASIAGRPEPFTGKLPPPEPEAYKAYYDCLNLLAANVSKRTAAE